MTESAAFDRITFEAGKMGGRACIRGMRITVSTVVGLLAEGETAAAIPRGLSRPRAGGHPAGAGLCRLAHPRGGGAGLSDAFPGDVAAAAGGARVAVILFRLRSAKTAQIGDRLQTVLASAADALDHGAVLMVETARLRVRRRPIN